MKATTLILQLLLLASIQQATAQEPDYEGYWCCASSDCYATTSGLPQHIQCLVNTHSSCTRPTPNACGGCTDPTGSGGGIATHAFDPNTGTCYDAGKLVGMLLIPRLSNTSNERFRRQPRPTSAATFWTRASPPLGLCAPTAPATRQWTIHRNAKGTQGSWL